MKHILFGIMQTPDKLIENKILQMYYKNFGKEFTFDSEFYLEGIYKALKDRQYDFIVLKEDLEPANLITIEYLDKIIDIYESNKIILIIGNEHQKDDFVKRLLNLGIFNVIYREDYSIEAIGRLIEEPRGRKDAKIYLDLNSVDTLEDDNFEEIPEEQLIKTLQSIKNADETSISTVFDHIDSSYNQKQILFLMPLLAKDSIEMLLKSKNPKFIKHYGRWTSVTNKYNKLEKEDTEPVVIIKKEVEEKIVEREVQKIVELEVEKVVKKVEKVEVLKTIMQQVVTFYTTDNNLTKDSVLTQIAVLLAQKSTNKILVIDMNTPTPNLDLFFNISNEVMVKDIYNTVSIDTGLSCCYGAIEKKIFNSELLKKFVLPYKNYKNLDILTGAYDLNLVEGLDINHYEKIISVASEIYSTILISVNPFWANTATYTAIAKSNKVIVTCDANWINARNTHTIIKKEYVDNQKIPAEKFKIIATEYSENSLSKEQIKQIFAEFEVLGFVPFNKHYQECMNKKKPLVLTPHAKKDIIAYLDIIGKLGYLPKISLKDRLFNKKKIINSIDKGEEV